MFSILITKFYVCSLHIICLLISMFVLISLYMCAQLSRLWGKKIYYMHGLLKANTTVQPSLMMLFTFKTCYGSLVLSYLLLVTMVGNYTSQLFCFYKNICRSCTESYFFFKILIKGKFIGLDLELPS